ncbi:MAG TPA: hypothetical protein VJ808_05475 [Gemmatimonadales bacterium]|nr:hypothetical protein [Gemmatimonadales bacterium]
MLSLLRRSRAMALAMVLLAPGISGSAVQWLHACPAEAQAAADHREHSDSSQPGHAQGCDCIGSCNASAPVAPAEPATLLVAVLQPQRRVPSLAGISFVPSGTPSGLLPPATAPPLA